MAMTKIEAGKLVQDLAKKGTKLGDIREALFKAGYRGPRSKGKVSISTVLRLRGGITQAKGTRGKKAAKTRTIAKAAPARKAASTKRARPVRKVRVAAKAAAVPKRAAKKASRRGKAATK